MSTKKTTPKKPVTPKKPSKPSKPAKASEAAKEQAPFTTTSAKAAYEHFLPLARTVSTEGLEVCRADVEIARVNLDAGVDALRLHVETIRKELPLFSITEAFELPALGLALMFSVGKIVKSASTGEIDRRLGALRPMREAALKQLEVFGLLGLIPAEVPTAIRKGKGPLDTARDAVTIPGVFHDHEATIGARHPFTSAMLKQLGEEGDWLVQQLKPTGAKGPSTERDPAGVVRDQLWAIINARYEKLRRAGAVLFGVKELDERVPPLGARLASDGRGASPAGGKDATPDGAKGGGL